MPIKDALYMHPIKSAVSVVTALSIIASGVIFVDTRYVHADDFKKVDIISEQTMAVIDALKSEKEIRILMLEMKKADPAQKLTPSEEIELVKLKEMVKKLEDAKKIPVDD